LNCKVDRQRSAKHVGLPHGALRGLARSTVTLPAEPASGVDCRGKFAPELAEGWTLGDMSITFTFGLRRGARFHDGSPVAAKDARCSLDCVLTEGGGLSDHSKGGGLAGAEPFVVVDDQTFRVDCLQGQA
jgi:ABC-type transport system substrate-binding protein